jgi:hypothetical protein
MTPHQVIAVVVRLFAIWVVIYVARTAPAFYHQLTSVNDTGAVITTVVISVVTILLVLLLWFFPRTVARSLLDAKVVAREEPASADTWFAVGCALIGLWLIVPALSSVIYKLSVLYLAQRDSEIDTTNLGLDLVYFGVEIAFGIWLLLGARGARKLFWWARDARLRSSSTPTPRL